MTDEHLATPSGVRRFDAKVTKDGSLLPGMDTPCREWTGAVDARGYPKFWLGRNSVTAQRAALLLAGTNRDPQQMVASACGNRLCVRREHLVVATVPEAHGMRSRGDVWIGPGERCRIRRVVGDGEATVEQVAEAWGIRRELVEQIVGLGGAPTEA